MVPCKIDANANPMRQTQTVTNWLTSSITALSPFSTVKLNMQVSNCMVRI